MRSTAERFADYALIIAEQLGDRVSRWITLNEPQVSADHGYRTGVHAPGLTDDVAAAAATHHLLLAHGLGAQALRSVHPATPVGITLDMHPVRLAEGTQPEAVEAARLATDAELNGLFLEPILHGRYPEHARASLLPARGPDQLTATSRRSGSQSTSSASTTTRRSTCAPATPTTCVATRSRPAASCRA